METEEEAPSSSLGTRYEQGNFLNVALMGRYSLKIWKPKEDFKTKSDIMRFTFSKGSLAST